MLNNLVVFQESYQLICQPYPLTGAGRVLSYVKSDALTASGAGTACNVTVDNERLPLLITSLFLEWSAIPGDLLSNGFTLSGITDAAGN